MENSPTPFSETQEFINSSFLNRERWLSENIGKESKINITNLPLFILFLKKLSENNYIYNEVQVFDRRELEATLNHENAHALKAEEYGLFVSYLVKLTWIKKEKEITSLNPLIRTLQFF